MQLANIIDCTLEDLQASQQHPERVSADPQSRTANWFLPTFENPYYGGVMTILRFAAHMQARGVHQRIFLCGSADTVAVHASIAKAFPALVGAEVVAAGLLGNVLRALDDLARGGEGRFGPKSFLDVPYPTMNKVAPPDAAPSTRSLSPLLRCFPVVCAVRTMEDDDSSMLLRQRFVASERCQFS
jgi:hypothetical protein